MCCIVSAFHHFLYCFCSFSSSQGFGKSRSRERNNSTTGKGELILFIESGYKRTRCVSVPNDDDDDDEVTFSPSCCFCSAGFACWVKRTELEKESSVLFKPCSGKVQEFRWLRMVIHTGGMDVVAGFFLMSFSLYVCVQWVCVSVSCLVCLCVVPVFMTRRRKNIAFKSAHMLHPPRIKFTRQQETAKHTWDFFTMPGYDSFLLMSSSSFRNVILVPRQESRFPACFLRVLHAALASRSAIELKARPARLIFFGRGMK